MAFHRIPKNAATTITAHAALVPNTRTNNQSISSIILPRLSVRKPCAAAVVDSYNNFVSVH